MLLKTKNTCLAENFFSLWYTLIFGKNNSVGLLKAAPHLAVNCKVLLLVYGFVQFLSHFGSKPLLRSVAQTAEALTLFLKISEATVTDLFLTTQRLRWHESLLDDNDYAFQCSPERMQSGAAGPPVCSAAAGSGCWSSSLWWVLTLGKLWSLPAPPLDTDSNLCQLHMIWEDGRNIYLMKHTEPPANNICLMLMFLTLYLC